MDPQSTCIINNEDCCAIASRSVLSSAFVYFVSSIILAPQLLIPLLIAIALCGAWLRQLWIHYLSVRFHRAVEDLISGRFAIRIIFNPEDLARVSTTKFKDDQHVIFLGILPSLAWNTTFGSTTQEVANQRVKEEISEVNSKQPKEPEKDTVKALVSVKKDSDLAVANEPEKDTVEAPVPVQKETDLVEEMHELLKTPKRAVPPTATKVRRRRLNPSLAEAASAIAAVVAEKAGNSENKTSYENFKKIREEKVKEVKKVEKNSADLNPLRSLPSSPLAERNRNPIPTPPLMPEAPVYTPGTGPPPPPPLPSTLERTVKFPKPSRPVKCFNWLPLPDFKIRGTVWEKARSGWPCVLKLIDLEELEEIFCQTAPGRRSSTPRPSLDRGRRGSIGAMGPSSYLMVSSQAFSVLDSRRAHNLNILLSSAVKLPIAELVNLISTMDPNNSLSGDVCSNLIRNFPTEDEERVLYRFRDNLANFASADRFLFELASIPRCRQKLSALAYRKGFMESVDQIRPKLEAVINCSRQLRDSIGFRRSLQIMLAVGNFLNSYSRPKPVNGFKITSLTRLGDTKSSKRTTFSLIDYIRKVLNHPPVCQHCYQQGDQNAGEVKVDIEVLIDAENLIKISSEVVDLKSAAAAGELCSLHHEISSMRSGMSKVEQESQQQAKTIEVAEGMEEQSEKVAASEKAFKDAMAQFCHFEGGKLVELEKLFEVAVDEYRRTLVYFGEIDQSVNSENLKKTIEASVDKPDNENEPSIFVIVDRFVTKVESSPAPMPPSFYSRRK